METVEFVQIEIFKGDTRVAFTAPASERGKLTRKAHAKAMRIIAQTKEQNTHPFVHYPISRVYVRRWRGVAKFETIDGQLYLIDDYCRYALDNMEQFYEQNFSDECRRQIDRYYREYRV